MKGIFAFALVAAASTAFAQPSRGIQESAGILVRSMGSSTTITLTGLDYHCESKQGSGSHGPTGKYDDCTGIPVVVLEDGGGECWSFLPYNRLVVHRKDKTGTARDVDIEWQLQQTDRFKFDTSKPGIDLKPTPQTSTGSAIDPQPNYYVQQSVTDKKIKWRLKGNAGIDFKFDHDAQVIRTADNHACLKVDPLITNAD